MPVCPHTLATLVLGDFCFPSLFERTHDEIALRLLIQSHPACRFNPVLRLNHESDGEFLEIGLVGFEPTASWSRTRRSTKLSHSPKFRQNKRWMFQRAYFAHFADTSKQLRQLIRDDKSILSLD